MKTFLALVAAVAMIVGALWWRGDIGNRGGAGDGGGIGLGRQPLRIVCVPELKAACDAFGEAGATARVEEAGATAAALAGAEPPAVDGWLTLRPWVEVVADTRGRASLPALPAAGAVVARSPLVMVAWQERFQVLSRACGDQVTWRCVGTQSGLRWADFGGAATWGQFKPGLRDPELTAEGLVTLGYAASQFFDTAAFSANDLQRPRFDEWLGRLKRAVPSHGVASATPLGLMLQRGPGAFDVVGTVEAESARTLRRAARAGELTVVYPQPLAVAEVVLAPLDEAAAGRLEELIADHGAAALARSGWRVEGQPVLDGVDEGTELPAEPNIPKAGVLEALRRRWGEIAR